MKNRGQVVVRLGAEESAILSVLLDKAQKEANGYRVTQSDVLRRLIRDAAPVDDEGVSHAQHG